MEREKDNMYIRIRFWRGLNPAQAQCRPDPPRRVPAGGPARFSLGQLVQKKTAQFRLELRKG